MVQTKKSSPNPSVKISMDAIEIAEPRTFLLPRKAEGNRWPETGEKPPMLSQECNPTERLSTCPREYVIPFKRLLVKSQKRRAQSELGTCAPGNAITSMRVAKCAACLLTRGVEFGISSTDLAVGLGTSPLK